MRRLPTLAVFLFITMTVAAQPSSFSVVVTNAPAGKTRLLIYDPEYLTPREVQPKMAKEDIVFTGKVKEPTYAEIVSPQAIMPFFIENSAITIKYDATRPDDSPIKGSRSNSMLRYQLEQCDGRHDCMIKYVSDNPQSTFAAYMIDRYISHNVDVATLQQLLDHLSGAATKTWHYRKLKNRMKALATNTDGSTLPSFMFEADKKTFLIDTLLSDSCDNIILVGATWCRQCMEAAATIKSYSPAARPIVINIDNDKRIWDAPVMQKLGIEHIPFIVIVDKDHKIVARDIRVWEMKIEDSHLIIRN